MTLQQLCGVTTVGQTGVIYAMAKKFIDFPAESDKGVRELKKEMGITIFERTNRANCLISKEGETFLGMMWIQVLEQAALLGGKYDKSWPQTGIKCFKRRNKTSG